MKRYGTVYGQYTVLLSYRCIEVIIKEIPKLYRNKEYRMYLLGGLTMLSVKTNLLAKNADRQLKANTNKNSKITEKLSSGYRINRAADDAAGLAISEKMRR